jgi:hypothetical protein
MSGYASGSEGKVITLFQAFYKTTRDEKTFT